MRERERERERDYIQRPVHVPRVHGTWSPECGFGGNSSCAGHA